MPFILQIILHGLTSGWVFSPIGFCLELFIYGFGVESVGFGFVGLIAFNCDTLTETPSLVSKPSPRMKYRLIGPDCKTHSCPKKESNLLLFLDARFSAVRI